MGNWPKVVANSLQLLEHHTSRSSGAVVDSVLPRETDSVRLLFNSIVGISKDSRAEKVLSNIEAAALQLGIHLKVRNVFDSLVQSFKQKV